MVGKSEALHLFGMRSHPQTNFVRSFADSCPIPASIAKLSIKKSNRFPCFRAAKVCGKEGKPHCFVTLPFFEEVYYGFERMKVSLVRVCVTTEFSH